MITIDKTLEFIGTLCIATIAFCGITCMVALTLKFIWWLI